MATKAKPELDEAEELVTIYPVGGKGYIQGVPSVEQEVTKREAKRLTAFDPPVFTLTKPKEARASEPEKE